MRKHLWGKAFAECLDTDPQSPFSRALRLYLLVRNGRRGSAYVWKIAGKDGVQQP